MSQQTTKNKYDIETLKRLNKRKETEEGYRYHGDGIAFRDEAEFHQFPQDYEGTVFKGNWENQIVVWCFRQEYVFLPQTSRHYPSSKSAMDALKSYIPDFDKKEAFLQNSKWVEEMCADHKLTSAYTRSKTETEFTQSHTDLWKAIDAMVIPV